MLMICFCVCLFNFISQRRVDGAERQEVLSTHNVTFDDLAPFTNYTFYVIAYGNHGGSDPSKMITVETMEDSESCFLDAILTCSVTQTFHVLSFLG